MSPKEIAAALGREDSNIKVMLMRLSNARVLHKTDYGKYTVRPASIISLPRECNTCNT